MQITLIDPHQMTVAAETDYPAEARRLQGNPKRQTFNHYTNAREDVFAGVWTTEAGSWKVVCDPGEEELFTIIEGHARMVDEDGKVTDIHAGQSAVVPCGFKGVFEAVTPVKKFYMIINRAV